MPRSRNAAANSLFLVAAAFMACTASSAKSSLGLRVGAARVSITPPREEFVGPFKRVNDEVYVRAVVIDNGIDRAVLVVADVPMIQAEVMAETVRDIAALAHVPEANVMLSASHTHNTIRVDRNPGGIILPGSPQYVERVTTAALAAVIEATDRLKPARMATGQGYAYLVGGKNSWSAEHSRTIEAVDRSGAETVSRALRVVKFADLEGKPISYVLNYAINPVIAMAMKDAISGDVPGAAARYVEQRSGPGAVALFTVGAAGNPLYRAEPEAAPGAPADPNALIQAMGTILGEEALAVARNARPGFDVVPISAVQRTLSCPGKVTAPLNLPDRCAHGAESALPLCDFKDRDTNPVALRMAALRIGDSVLVQSDSDISSAVGLRLQRQSPIADTWIVSLNYGPMRYVVADSDYPLNTYEATASTAKRGCAESGFLSAANEMIARVRN